jgi:hypothetical protein
MWESIPALKCWSIVGPFHSKPISGSMLVNLEDFPYDVCQCATFALTELLQELLTASLDGPPDPQILRAVAVTGDEDTVASTSDVLHSRSEECAIDTQT